MEQPGRNITEWEWKIHSASLKHQIEQRMNQLKEFFGGKGFRVKMGG